MKDFFYWIQDFFNAVLFKWLDKLRAFELESWFGANIINWLLMLIGFVAMVYWVLQLKKHAANGEEDKSVSAHSYI